MAMPQVNALTPRCAEPALPGTWKLAPGRAITLEPREAGVFKVAHGQLWATFDGPHEGRPDQSGDWFLGAGETLRLQPGQRLVVEAWNEGCPGYFSWDPLPVTVRRMQWADIVQPVSDLRLALVFGGHAVARLVVGIGQIGWQSLFGPRISAEEKACTRHGAHA
ncbi:MAG: DUF2917 domain-containing protein [Alphaproteobacteria bacterium]|nr:MAG: DUF2917 domain-containing protein [Alphaproteobacteria bacterium]